MRQSGQTVVEVLMAIALSMIILPVLATSLVSAGEGRAQEEQRIQASSLQREAEEAVRSIREKGWTNIATNGTYHPTVAGTTWSLAANAEVINGITRQIVISDVQRNSVGAIVPSGGTVDPSTKQAIITTNWTTPINSTLSSTLYLTRYAGNATWIQTTQADFNLGTHSNTVATATGGGQVELAPVVFGSWATPTKAGVYNTGMGAGTRGLTVVGTTAYVVGGNLLKIINITNPATPTLIGSFTGTGSFTDVRVSGNYAYLTSTDNTNELAVVNITTPSSPTLAASFGLAGNSDATSIEISGNFAYIGKLTNGGSPEFFVVNITTPTAPTLAGSLNLSDSVNDVYISGTNAFLATAINASELLRINISTPATPTQTGLYNTPVTLDGLSVTGNGTTIYMGTQASTGPEFFAINGTTMALLGTYEIGANVNGVKADATRAYLSTANAATEFFVLNITAPAAITLIGTLGLPSTAYDVYQTGDYAYVTTFQAGEELTVIHGGPGGTGYQTSGTFTSSSFDATTNVGFNYLAFTDSLPASTNIQIQIAVNNDNATWNYVGPDGTAGAHYTAAAAIPLNNASGRYFRYQATLTGPGTSTPALQDVTLNYSP